MAVAVLLGVLLVVLVELARAAAPLIPLGVSAIRAVAPRVLSSAASNPAAVSVVGGGLRVTASQGASIAGMGAVITVQRTAQRDALAAAMLGLGTAALVGEAVIDAAIDAVDCDLGPGTAGFRCATAVDRVSQPTRCVDSFFATGVCGGQNITNETRCFTSQGAFEEYIRARRALSGRNPVFSSRRTLSTGHWEVTFSETNGSPCTSRNSASTHSTVRMGAAELACPAGTEPSRNEPTRCRAVDPASWPSVSSDAVQSRLAASSGWASVGLGGWLGNRGVEIPDAGAPTVVVDAPASIRLGDYVREWELPDGSIVRETTEWRADQTWEDDVITSRTRAERRVEPPGAVVPSTPPTREESRLPPPVPGGGVTPAPAPTPTEPPEDKECGLPGTPPCKIDESGTPTGEAVAGPEAIDPVVDQLESCISNPASCLPALPSLSWNFALPTNCSAIPTPAFSPALEEIDVCAFQPTIHDLMSVVWMLGGLFGAIGLFWRKTLAS